MSKAAACDRCGAFYLRDIDTDELVKSPDSSRAFNEMTFRYCTIGGKISTVDLYELCPDCRHELNEWLRLKTLIKGVSKSE